METSDIKISEKTGDDSYRDIYHALWEPLEDCRRDCDTFTTDLSRSLGETGVCFVALHDDDIIGTLSVKLAKREKWFARGQVVYCMYVRVAPAWQGKHIFSMLIQMSYEYARLHNCTIIILETGANNKHAIEVYTHLGFRIVRLFHPKNSGFKLVMAKYLDNTYPRLKLCLVDMGIRMILPLYRAARKFRDVYRNFRDHHSSE